MKTLKNLKKRIRPYIMNGTALFIVVASMILTMVCAEGIDNSEAPDGNQTITTESITESTINNSLSSDDLLNEKSTADNLIKDSSTSTEEAQVSSVEETYETYTVKSGDCLWNIACKYYGSGVYCEYLAGCNDIDVNSPVHIGQTLKVYSTLDHEYTMTEKLVYNSQKSEATSSKSSVSVSNDTSSKNTSNMKYLGNYWITGYNAWDPKQTDGNSNGVTASGKVATAGKTIAMKGIPFGTEIYIKGLGYYVVEDRGVGNGVVDVACDNTPECYQITRYADVYICK